MGDNFMLVKGESGLTEKVKLFDLGDGTYSVAPATRTGILLASDLRDETGDVESDDQINHHAKGVLVLLDVEEVDTSNPPSLVLKIQGMIGEEYYDILQSAAVTTKSKNVYRVHPVFEAVSNLVAQDVLPRDWRVIVTHGNAEDVTYSVSYSTIL